MSTSRILVRVPNWLGDVVMALPAIAAVRRHFAEAQSEWKLLARLQVFPESENLAEMARRASLARARTRPTRSRGARCMSSVPLLPFPFPFVFPGFPVLRICGFAFSSRHLFEAHGTVVQVDLDGVACRKAAFEQGL